MVRDCARHRPRSAPRRGDGPHRGIRRRQIDDRTRRHGLHPRRLPHLRRHHRVRRHGADLLPRRGPAHAAWRAHRLRGAVGGRVVQPGAQADRPAHRGAGAAQDQDPARERSGRDGSLPAPAPAQPRGDRLPLPAPSLGGTAPACDDRDGDELPARPDHLRRADHRARRHHPDRGARRDPRHRRPVQHRRALHHARPRGRCADGRPHQGAAQGRRDRRGRHPLHALVAEGGLHQVVVGRCAASSASRSRWPLRARRR